MNILFIANLISIIFETLDEEFKNSPERQAKVTEYKKYILKH